jgi:Flp pilus assembly pilin Flp
MPALDSYACFYRQAQELKNRGALMRNSKFLLFLFFAFFVLSYLSYVLKPVLYAPIRSYQKKNPKKTKSTAGQALTEYVLILGLVAIICLAGVRIFSAVVNKYYSNIATVYTVPIP